MAASPSPTTSAAFRFDSFDLEAAGGMSRGATECGLSSPTPQSPTPIPTSHKGNGERLVQEVTRLYRERNRLARVHRKAELRVLASLRRRRQSEDGGVEEVEEEEEDDGEGRVDWVGQAGRAREALAEADRSATAQELHYRLLLEEARRNTSVATTQVSLSMKKFIEVQKQLVKQSFSPLPPERDRQEVVESLLQRQQKALEQLKQARTSYFSLLLRKQQEDKALEESQENSEDQVCMSEMLRLVVETEAFTEEAGLQEASMLTHQASLRQTAAKLAKQKRLKHDLQEQITQAQKSLSSLKQQLAQEKEKLRDLSKKQAKTRKASESLKPSTRLVSDPVLARDLEEKLALKARLEEELKRLKQVCELRAGEE